MSLSNIGWQDYFYPLSPQIPLSLEQAKKSKTVTSSLLLGSKYLSIIAATGLMMAQLPMCFRLRLFSFKIPFLSSLLLTITYAALGVLGLYFYYIGYSNTVHFNEEALRELAFKEFKTFLEKWPIHNLEQGEEITPSNTANLEALLHTLADINAIYPLATPVYDSLEHQPKFDIHSEHLSLEQQQELLDLAYQKGIVLLFSSYSYQPNSEIRIERETNIGQIYGQACLEKMQKAHLCSIEFVKRRIENANTTGEFIDMQKINNQLNALGFRWGKNQVLHPTILYYDTQNGEKWVGIRGNCSEIGNPEQAIEILSPYVTGFTIDRIGLLFISQFYLNQKWETFKQELQAKYRQNTFRFIEDLENTIRQKNSRNTSVSGTRPRSSTF